MTSKINAKNASPRKLRDDTWGAWVDGGVEVGDLLQVTTRAGKTWQATVTQVVASTASGCLVRTARANDVCEVHEAVSKQTARRSHGGICRDCRINPATHGSLCYDCV